LSSPFHDDAYYAERAGYLAHCGSNSVVLVDLAGGISPGITRNLVSAVRAATGSLPIEFRTHCRSGVAEMSCFEAVSCGADVLHVATETLSGGWSLPSAGYFAEHFSRWQTAVSIDPGIIAEMDEYFLALAEAHDLPRGCHALPDPLAERLQIPVTLLARLEAAAESGGVPLGTLMEECRRVQQELGWPTLAHPMGAIVIDRAITNITNVRTCPEAAMKEVAVSDPEQRLLSHWFLDRDVAHLKSVPEPVQGATPAQYLKAQLEKFPALHLIRVRKGEFLFDLKRGTK
jgi:oxaloacetate decarboxylase (Na+ extruding) subunit alpha